jgi:hypothetical protein
LPSAIAFEGAGDDMSQARRETLRKWVGIESSDGQEQFLVVLVGKGQITAQQLKEQYAGRPNIVLGGWRGIEGMRGNIGQCLC